MTEIHEAANPPKPVNFGTKLKDTATANPLIVLIAVFVSGVVSTSGFYEWAKPWRLDKDYRQLEQTEQQTEAKMPVLLPAKLPHVKAPIKVAVLGPLSGSDADFGLAQLRGVVSAAMHATVEYFQHPAEEWQKFFSIRPINIDFANSGSHRNDQVVRAFEEAESDDNVVFGPVSSQDAVELLVNRKEDVKVPTIVTVAATPKIHENIQYGKLLLQLSPNIDAYANQYARYIGQFLQPRPKHVLLFARDDEYGRSSAIALTTYLAGYNVELTSKYYVPSYADDLTDAKYAKATLDANSSSLDGARQIPDDWLIMIADTNTMLRELVKGIRTMIPHIRMGTLSSPDVEEVSTGAYEGMYLIYSFAPVQFSLDTLAFYQYARSAEPFMDELLEGELKPQHWPRLETVDAEVHDAAMFWIQHFAIEQLDNLKPADLTRSVNKNLYVTNFAIRGDGPSIANEGALYLFKVQNKRIVPVEVDVQ